MFFDHYPYTNFHNVNLDWVLQAVKAWGLTVEANDQAFQDLKAANESFKAYVTNYLQDLDVSDEINTKLDAMLASGVLTPYFAPYVQGYVNSWLNSHVTPTSPALDNTLTLSGAAARADATGKRLKDLAYIDALSTPEVVAALNRSQVLPGYRVQGITYDYDGHYYVCGGSVDEDGSGVIVKMTKPDFTDAEITEIPQLGHANDITYYNGYLYVCTVGGGDAPQWGIYKINANDFTDKTLISNAPENTIGISYRQGDFWILAPYRIYRTTDFTSYEVVVANTNDLLTAYGIPTSGRISQTLFRTAGYLIGWVCSFVFEDRHYGALTFFNSTGEPVAFKMFPAYHSEIQGAVYADMSIYLLADGDMVNVFRMDPRHLSYVQLKAGDDLNSFTGRGTLYSTGSNVSSELVNSPSSGEGFTVQVERLGVYNTIQTARTNSGRELYRVKSFSAGTWGEWIEPDAEVAQIKEDLSALSGDISTLYFDYLASIQGINLTTNGVTFRWDLYNKSIHAVGTANSMAFSNLYFNHDALIPGISAGDVFQLLLDSSDTLALRVGFYNGTKSLGFGNYYGNAVIKVPDNATGMYIRANVMSGVTLDETLHYSLINSTKTCLNLHDTHYFVKNISMPTGLTIRGCGNATVLELMDSAESALTLSQGCTVENVKIIGTGGVDWTPDGTITDSHGVKIAVVGSSNAERNRIKISNVEICGFTGGAICMAGTGVNYDNSACVVNAYLHNNNVGVYIPQKSEFNKFSNVASSRNYYGCINNGGNNLFSNCGFNGNVTGLLMDSTGITNPNNSHGSFVGCNFNHSHSFNDSTSLYAIDLIGQASGEIFSACTVAYGNIRIASSSGIVFDGCNFLSDTAATVSDGGLTMFNGCLFLSAAESPLTISGSAVVKYHNCYTRAGITFNPAE